MNPYLLELHYYLPPGEHAMDAFTRNKCEAEALAAFMRVCQRLGIELTVESVAHAEGGLRDAWRFAIRPEHAYTNLVLLLSLLLPNFITIWNAPPKPDKELEAINKELAKATLEEKRLIIEKTKKELQKAANQVTPPPVPAASAPAVQYEDVEVDVGGGQKQLKRQAVKQAQIEAVVTKQRNAVSKKAIAILADDPKFSTRRSNFYKALLSYEKVRAVGWSVVQDGESAPEVVVPKKDFVKFVLTTDKLPTRVIEDAVIEIVAPVIREGGMNWKGLYLGEPIGFAMKDDAFKSAVLRRAVSFQAGNAIRCGLEVAVKLDETGEEVVIGYSVPVVMDLIDESGAVETPQGRRHRFNEKQRKNQRDLDLDGAEVS